MTCSTCPWWQGCHFNVARWRLWSSNSHSKFPLNLKLLILSWMWCFFVIYICSVAVYLFSLRSTHMFLAYNFCHIWHFWIKHSINISNYFHWFYYVISSIFLAWNSSYTFTISCKDSLIVFMLADTKLWQKRKISSCAYVNMSELYLKDQNQII